MKKNIFHAPLVLHLIFSLGAATALLAGDQSYAGRLLAPFAGMPGKGSVVPRINQFPVKVAFKPTPYYTSVAESNAKEGFEEWSTASNGDIDFTFSTSPNPIGAMIVVEFVIRQQIAGLQGRTTLMGSYVLLQIAVDNPQAPPPFFQTEKHLKRVSAHEMGHALGIDGHSPDPSDIMGVDDQTTRVSKGDIATLREAYGGRFPR